VANPDVFDITDAPFTLCKLDLLNPNGFAFYRAGSPVEILWASEMVGDLTLSYKTSFNGEWITIDEGVAASTNSYIWTPEETTNVGRVQIKETSFPEVSDESDNNFIVFRLDLTSPSGGENLTGNSQFDISWDSEIISSVMIEFTSDNGQNWSTVTGSPSAGNSIYDWTVPNINSDECFVKLTTPGLPDLYSVNETPFSIFEFTRISYLSETDEFGLMISPNPVLNEACISFSIPDEYKGSLMIQIYNTNGEIILNQSIRKITAGKQIMKLDLKELPGGLYVIKLIGNTNYSSHKFIKKTR